jgi:hypothetical protein
VGEIHSQVSRLEACAAAIGINLGILDAKVIFMIGDISDLKGDVSRLKTKTND